MPSHLTPNGTPTDELQEEDMVEFLPPTKELIVAEQFVMSSISSTANQSPSMPQTLMMALPHEFS